MRLFSSKLKVAALICVATGAIGALAYAASPVDTIKERQDGLKSMGKIFKAMTDQMRAGSVDPATVKEAAATIQKTAGAMDKWFPKGSGAEAGVKTAAKPEIWSDSAGFNDARQKLVDAAGKFSDIANGGDMSAVGGGVRGLGMACKGCHDKYRVKED